MTVLAFQADITSSSLCHYKKLTLKQGKATQQSCGNMIGLKLSCKLDVMFATQCLRGVPLTEAEALQTPLTPTGSLPNDKLT